VGAEPGQQLFGRGLGGAEPENPAPQASQFSTFSPGTRLNSPALAVTTVAAAVRARDRVDVSVCYPYLPTPAPPLAADRAETTETIARVPCNIYYRLHIRFTLL
jgi:hypothetical protein